MSDMMRPSEEERRLADLVAERVACSPAQIFVVKLSEADKVEIRQIVREEVRKALRTDCLAIPSTRKK